MTQKQFISFLLENGFESEDYNSCNAWGFGGMRGTLFIHKEKLLKIKIGKAFYRHLPPESIITVWNADYGTFFDVLQSSAKYDKIAEKILTIINS